MVVESNNADIFLNIGSCASTVMEVKKNCKAILIIVAAGRQFFTINYNREEKYGYK